MALPEIQESNTEDEAIGADSESRFSEQLSRARSAARAARLAKKGAQAQAVKAAKQWAWKLILPYLLPALGIIGIILVIVGLTLFLVSMFSAPGNPAGAALSQ